MSGAVQAGWAPPSGPPEPAPERGRPRWLLAATVAWAVLLAGLTWWSVRHDPPTVREQRPLSAAARVTDRAVGQLVAATGDAAWVLTEPRLDRGCRVTPMADGVAYRRGVDVVLPEGGERALLDRVAARLPGDWRAGVRSSSSGPRLRADAGEFVLVQGWVASLGRVRFAAETGCRPADAEFADLLPGPPGEPALDEALRALGRTAEAGAGSLAAPCPGGGNARTRWATAGAAPAPLAGLKPLAAGAALLDTPEVYAYRRGPAVVVADATGERLRLAASTGCAG
ncbi:hypothetical protein GCM10023176_29130 [Micromonospora coerulea]|uniref:Uncharacterized protein n=1 Tax=Micromonospora coerulea TaxID=47856 RepID=A0ABP8SLA5_9ACTN